MSKHNRTFYLVRWECNTSDDWCIVGTYYYKDTAIEKAKHFQEVNTFSPCCYLQRWISYDARYLGLLLLWRWEHLGLYSICAGEYIEVQDIFWRRDYERPKGRRAAFRYYT